MPDIVDRAQEHIEREQEAMLARLRQSHAPPPVALNHKRACCDCGCDIPPARLRANPAATRCIECETDEEQLQKHYRRPL